MSDTAWGGAQKGKKGVLLPRFSSAIEQLLVVISVCLLLLPKVNLLTVSDQTAGIRLDDVLLAMIGAGLVIGFLWVGRNRFTRVEVTIALIVALGLLSNLVNQYCASRSSVLYSLRLSEYFTFFYVGAYFYWRHKMTTLAWSVLLLNGVAIVLQKVGILGEWVASGFVAHASRPAGLTGGPWEVGVVVNICYSILLFDRESIRTKRFAVGLFVASFAVVILTGSRMATTAHLLVFLCFLYQHSKSRFRFAVSSSIVIMSVWVSVLILPSEVMERSANLSSNNNIELVNEIYRNAQPLSGPREYDDIPMSAEADISLLMRTSNWSMAVKTWMLHEYSWFIGVGPGTLGTAVDGGWLRLLTETGAIGILIFVMMLCQVSKVGMEMCGAVLSLSTSMVMIDIHLAYKAMSLFFFAAGYYCQLQARVERGDRGSSLRRWALGPNSISIARAGMPSTDPA